MRQETLTPAYTLGQKMDCSFPKAIFTIDSSTYTYQFVGSPFFLNSLTTLPSVLFRVHVDGNVLFRDPKTGRSFELMLFRKIAGPSYSSNPVLPKKLNHRAWVKAEISMAIPHVIDTTELLVLASAPKLNIPPPCVYHTTWEYTVEAQGKSYVVLWRNGEPLNITIHGANQFALGKNGSAYLIDDGGKERKVQLAATAKNP